MEKEEKKKPTAIRIGRCVSCDTEIFKKNGRKMVPTDAYREHTFGLSNESMMVVGVCSTCKEVLDRADAEAEAMAARIIDRHKAWWNENIPTPDGERAFHDGLIVVDISTDEKKWKARMAEMNEEKRITREWQSAKAKKKPNRGGVLLPDGKQYIEPEETLSDYKKRTA